MAHQSGPVVDLRAFDALPDRPLDAGRRALVELRGIGFERLLGDPALGFQVPFDPRFGKMLVKTAAHLVAVGLARFVFAERDALVAVVAEELVGRAVREVACRAAAEASGKLSLLVGAVAPFDVRLFEAPPEVALEALRVRQLRAAAVALDAYCSDALTRSGAGDQAMAKLLPGMGDDEKLELLRQHGIDYHALPAWQRRGAAVFRDEGAEGVVIDTAPPEGAAFTAYLARHALGAAR